MVIRFRGDVVGFAMSLFFVSYVELRSFPKLDIALS